MLTQCEVAKQILEKLPIFFKRLGKQNGIMGITTEVTLEPENRKVIENFIFVWSDLFDEFIFIGANEL